VEGTEGREAIPRGGLKYFTERVEGKPSREKSAVGEVWESGGKKWKKRKTTL